VHPFFAPLSELDATLLLATLTVGGRESVDLFRHLPSDRAARLQEKAEALLAIPREKSVPFMVKELKEAVALRGLRGVELADPSWLLDRMRGERARTIAAILYDLPPSVVRSVLKRLPPGIRSALPARSELAAVSPVLLRAVRERYESRFHPMPRPSGGQLSFHTLIRIDRAHLNALMRYLGLVELGQAFVAVGKLALAELCRRLPPEQANELIQAVRTTPPADVPEVKTAQQFLAKVLGDFKDTDELFQHAGLWRFAKACLAEQESFRLAFCQRFPKSIGELFLGYCETAATIETLTDEATRNLQDSILLGVRDLAQRGLIDANLASMQLRLHDPTRLERDALEDPGADDEPS